MRSESGAARTWWLAQLAGAPELISLPADRPRPDVQATPARHVDVRLHRQLTARVVSLGARASATLNSALLAMWSALLLHLSEQADVVVGLPHSMRHAEELQPIIGMFINTLPLRLTHAYDASVVGALGATHRAATRALQHASAPLHTIVAASGVQRATSHSPLFQPLFQVNSLQAAAADAEDSQLNATQLMKMTSPSRR